MMRSIFDFRPRIGRNRDKEDTSPFAPRIGHNPDESLASVGAITNAEVKYEVEFKTAAEDDVDLNIDRVLEILKLLILPGIFMGSIILLKIPMPKLVLYGIAAAILGMIVVRAHKTPEIILAVSLLYFPFAKLYAVSIAPMVNGTNVFIALCLYFAIRSARDSEGGLLPAIKGRNLVLWWWVLSCGSLITLGFTPGALSWVIGYELSQATAWVAQAGFYVAVIGLVRTPGQAKRMAIYSMIGTLLVVGIGTLEWIDKRGASRIEKARVGGTFENPNDFGGFLAFTMLPIIALVMFNMYRPKAWLLTPYLFLSLKVLMATFSRAALLALACGGIAMSYLRGMRFLVFWACIGIGGLAAFPSLIPESILARFSQTTEVQSATPGKLDKSSEHRLILWKAAGVIIAESPFFGNGFKSFPFLKDRYTEKQVEEGDPHNMYLYIATQMGVPALLIFLLIKARFMWMGWQLYRRSNQHFERVLGASSVAMVSCLAVINMFGSRMVNLEFTAYFYAYLVIMQVLYTHLLKVERLRNMTIGDPELEVKEVRNLVKTIGLVSAQDFEKGRLGYQAVGRRIVTKVGTGKDSEKIEMRIGLKDPESLDAEGEERDVKIGFDPAKVPEPVEQPKPEARDSERVRKSARMSAAKRPRAADKMRQIRAKKL